MIIKTKCVLLKENVNPQELEKYGFKNNGNNYWLDVDGFERIGWYKDTKRFVFKYPRSTKPRKIMKYLPQEMNDLIEIKDFYDYLVIFGSWTDFSDEKLERINRKLDRLNGNEVENE